MSRGIKTREVVKDIKIHDSAVNVRDRMKNIGVKTKDTVNESINQTDNISPEQYASDKITETMKTGTETVTICAEKAIHKGTKKAIEKVKEKRAEDKKKEDDKKSDEEKPSEESAPENENPAIEENSTEKQSETAEPKTEPKQKKNDNNPTQAKKENGDVKGKQDKTTVKEKTQAPPKSKQQTDTPVDEIKKPRQR